MLQLAPVVVGFAWAWGVVWIMFVVVKNFMKIWVSPEAELEGLDMPEFGVLAYPDFVLATDTIGHAAHEYARSPGGAPTASYAAASPPSERSPQ